MEQPKSYFPIMLDVGSLHWLIVGGGTIATRKVNSLLKQGALHLTVVAPQLSDELALLLEAEKFKYFEQAYHVSHLKGQHIIYAATDDILLNRIVCRDAKLNAILVCNVSEQDKGNYITPSFFQRKDLICSVSSQGKSPILAKVITDEWAKHIDEGLAERLPLLEKLRQDLKRDIEQPALRQLIMREATPQLLYEDIKDYNKWYKSLLKHNC